MTNPREPFTVTSQHDPDQTRHFISLGAGVQSTVLYLMAATGLLRPTPIAAIFADTGWEPDRVYQHLLWLESLILPCHIPIHRVTAGDLYDNVWHAHRAERSGQAPFTDIPSYVRRQDGTIGMRRRQCTVQYKIKPIFHKVRELLQRRPYTRHTRGPYAVQWIGISTDEWRRAKDATTPWIANRYPLIDLGMNRQDCAAWFARHHPGQPLAKSSCIGCPYHSDRQWLQLYREDPDAMHRAIALDQQLRTPERISAEHNGIPQFLHRTCEPLDQVLERLDRTDRHQPRLIDDNDHFGNECGGYCRT